MKKVIKFQPAWDNSSKGQGIGSMYIRFLYYDKLGVVQFVMSTGWYLPLSQDKIDENRLNSILVPNTRFFTTKQEQMFNLKMYRPTGVDVGYHSHTPMYEGQNKRDHCEYLNGPCYYDGSSLAAEDLLDRFLAGGEEVVWKYLKEYYTSRFES